MLVVVVAEEVATESPGVLNASAIRGDPVHPRRAVLARLARGCTLLLVLVTFALSGCATGGASREPAGDPSSQLSSTSTAPPRFVSAGIRASESTLIAGEQGVLDLELSLLEPMDASRGGPAWDADAPAPVIWLSAPADSGIRFGDRTSESRPGQQRLVRFRLRPDAPRTLTARVEYSVNRRTKASTHNFWMDVSAGVVTADGRRIQDEGVVSVLFRVDTHLRTKLLMLLVIAVVVLLFITEWVRVDVVAMMMMVLLPELGLLDARYTFRGLSSNAVVAIIGVMIISFGLNRVGLVTRVVRLLHGYVGQSAARMIAIFSSLIAVISSVMQNTGAAVLFLPAIRITCIRQLKMPISRVLMPIGMAAILGGTLTMIGTSPLILLNDLLPAGMPKFGLLELTPIGLALVIGGLLYLVTGGRFLLFRLPASQATMIGPGAEAGGSDPFSSYQGASGPYVMVVPEEYDSSTGLQTIVDIRRRRQVNIVAVIHSDGSRDDAPTPSTRLMSGMSICAFGAAERIQHFAREYGLELQERTTSFRDLFNPAVAGEVEIVVSPRSGFIGRTIKEIRFRETFGVSPLALHHNGLTFYQGLAERPLRSGDVILAFGTWERVRALREFHQNFIFVCPSEEECETPHRMKPALTCFLSTLGLMLISSFAFQGSAYNPIPLSVCLMAGAVGMIVTGVVTVGEAYRAVDWRTVFLLGGLIPLGMAVDQTGTAEWIARGIVAGLGSSMTPLLLLIVLATLSCAFSLVISNVGACTLLVPLGISIATRIGIDPRVAAIVVGLGVSNSFILPTHQVNALYMGPGEYRTRDYIKIGGILSVIYMVILVAMTYWFYL